MELIFWLFGQALAAFFSLPPPLQVGLLVAFGWLVSYRRGWNSAVEAAYRADIAKAEDTRRARRW